MGLAKFASLILFSGIASAFISVGMLAVFPGIAAISSGPIASIFALLPYYNSA